LQVIQQAKSLKVLVIGDSCTDKFVYGTCDRLSPEAPVPVLKHTKTKEMPGMAGNVVENVKAFSDSVELLTQGHVITKVRYVDSRSNQHIMRFDTEPDCDRQHDVFFANGDHAMAAISGEYDVVIMSDYNKGFLKRKQIISLTDRMQQVVYVDSKKPDISCFKNSIVKLNQKEFEASGHTLAESSTLVKTLGSKGASCNGQIYPSEPVEVFDVSGAGDTFLSSFAIYHTVTNNVIDAIKFANKCASVVVQRKGTYALRKNDLIEAI
jgi:D-glycero-beta-D-manno-heptose-7-phosphate kinase